MLWGFVLFFVFCFFKRKNDYSFPGDEALYPSQAYCLNLTPPLPSPGASPQGSEGSGSVRPLQLWGGKSRVPVQWDRAPPRPITGRSCCFMSHLSLNLQVSWWTDRQSMYGTHLYMKKYKYCIWINEDKWRLFEDCCDFLSGPGGVVEAFFF